MVEFTELIYGLRDDYGVIKTNVTTPTVIVIRKAIEPVYIYIIDTHNY